MSSELRVLLLGGLLVSILPLRLFLLPPLFAMMVVMPGSLPCLVLLTERLPPSTATCQLGLLCSPAALEAHTPKSSAVIAEILFMGAFVFMFFP